MKIFMPRDAIAVRILARRSVDAQSVAVDGYTIDLKSLEPYPRTPDDGVALEEYTATLVVRR